MGPDIPLKILFIVPYAPSRIRTRPFHLIRALVRGGHRVTLATVWVNRTELDAVRQLAGDVEGLLTERVRLNRTVWNCVRGLRSSQPVQSYYSWSPALARRILQAVSETDFDVAHVEHLRGVRYALMLEDAQARTVKRRTPVVWDSVDCISDLFRSASLQSSTLRSRLTSRIELSRTERYEGFLATRFGRILVTSEADRRGLLKLAEDWNRRHGKGTSCFPPERIAVIPNGVDPDYYSPGSEGRDRHTVVISGKMSYHANVTAVVRFVREVMPRIWADLPDAQLWIAGSDPVREILRLGVPWGNGRAAAMSSNGRHDPRVRITGTVDDIRPFLQKAAVAVAPIAYGAGIQNKVLEAMACATPLVATPQAVAALDVKPGQNVLVADNPEELAGSVLSLLRDGQRCEELGRAGRMFVKERHDWRSIVHDLTRIYRHAGT